MPSDSELDDAVAMKDVAVADTEVVEEPATTKPGPGSGVIVS